MKIFATVTLISISDIVLLIIVFEGGFMHIVDDLPPPVGIPTVPGEDNTDILQVLKQALLISLSCVTAGIMMFVLVLVLVVCMFRRKHRERPRKSQDTWVFR